MDNTKDTVYIDTAIAALEAQRKVCVAMRDDAERVLAEATHALENIDATLRHFRTLGLSVTDTSANEPSQERVRDRPSTSVAPDPEAIEERRRQILDVFTRRGGKAKVGEIYDELRSRGVDVQLHNVRHDLKRLGEDDLVTLVKFKNPQANYWKLKEEDRDETPSQPQTSNGSSRFVIRGSGELGF